jgi:hypothetical protein
MNFSSLFIGETERRLWRWWKETTIGMRVAAIVLIILVVGTVTGQLSMQPSYLQQEQNRAAACAEILAKARATGKADEKTGACLILLSIEGDRLRLGLQ